MGYQIRSFETEERKMRNASVKAVALGGMLASVSVVIICLGGLIPLATFICPMLCIMTGHIVLRSCGTKIAWCWYGVVSILCLLMAPDKEAAMLFLFLGYYPFGIVSFYGSSYTFFIKVVSWLFGIDIYRDIDIYIHGEKKEKSSRGE